jgi:hypothetical protein
MINELWGSFPRLLEQNINGLLDTAEPNPTKAFQLYKSCKNEGLWGENFDQFSRVLREFYTKPRGSRRKSAFDQYLDRPLPSDVFLEFHLNFRTAVVDDRAVTDLASWAHNLMRVSKKSLSAVMSLDVMTRTLRTIVTPGPLDKAENVEFIDFCAAWKKTVGRLFGSSEVKELDLLVVELQEINSAHRDLEEISGLIRLPLLQMTPVELDWIKMVRLAALANAKIPRVPESTTLRKHSLRGLDRVIQLYELVLVTQLPELLKHRESTRLTLIDRCNGLISEAEPQAA